MQTQALLWNIYKHLKDAINIKIYIYIYNFDIYTILSVVECCLFS